MLAAAPATRFSVPSRGAPARRPLPPRFGVNWGSPQAQGLRFWWPLASPARNQQVVTEPDLCGHQDLSWNVAAQRVRSHPTLGLAVDGAQSRAQQLFAAGSGLGTGPQYLSLWFVPAALGGQQVILDGFADAQLRLECSGTTLRGMFSAAWGSSYAAATTPLEADALYHAIIGYDGTAYFLYLNGRLEGGANPGLPVTSPPTGLTLNVASDGSVPFTGLVADLRWYFGQLSPAVARAMYEPATRWDLYAVQGQPLWFLPFLFQGNYLTEAPSGGLLGGGAATDAWVASPAPRGGLQAGAVATPLASYPQPERGGGAALGAFTGATQSLIPEPSGGLAGGASLDGSEQATYSPAPSGGLLGGAVATSTQSFLSLSPSGGGVTGSTAPADLAYVPAASGGLAGGGQLTPLAQYLAEAAGGVVPGSPGTVLASYAATAQGGLVPGSEGFSANVFEGPASGGLTAGIVLDAVAVYDVGPQGGAVVGSSNDAAASYLVVARGGTSAGAEAAPGQTFPVEAPFGGLAAGGQTTELLFFGVELSGGLTTGAENGDPEAAWTVTPLGGLALGGTAPAGLLYLQQQAGGGPGPIGGAATVRLKHPQYLTFSLSSGLTVLLDLSGSAATTASLPLSAATSFPLTLSPDTDG